MRRLMATGVDLPEARSQVARGSARSGAVMGGVAALGSGAIQIIMDPGDPRAWRSAAINVPVSAAGGYGEAWMLSQYNMRFINPLLTRAAAPGVTAGTSRLLTGGGFLGRGAGISGTAAITAPAITMASMGIEDLFFGADYTRIDYAAKGARSAVSGGVAAGGGWLAAGGVGALAGSEFPILGTAVGFLVGVGLYFLADATIGEDVEAGVRESAGEQGCVGGRMGNTWSSSSSRSSTPSPSTPLLPFICFSGDTPILLADGAQKRIDAICVGDRVLSFDEATGDLTPQPVIATPSAIALDMLEIELDDGTTLHVTPAHELRTPEGWVAAGELSAGRRLMACSNASDRLDQRRVVAITIVTRTGPVYDLTIALTHTYFAGGVLAHNKIM
jgi:hypothetical protein